LASSAFMAETGIVFSESPERRILFTWPLVFRYEVEQILLNNLQVCQTESEHRFAT
jgi:hypothetical protein